MKSLLKLSFSDCDTIVLLKNLTGNISFKKDCKQKFLRVSFNGITYVCNTKRSLYNDFNEYSLLRSAILVVSNKIIYHNIAYSNHFHIMFSTESDMIKFKLLI